MRFLNRSAGRLSRHRRKPLAGLVVLLLGLVLTGGLYSLFSPGAQAETSTTSEDVTKGRELFIVGCSFCHGQNGEGVLTDNGTQYGPALTDVGAASVDRSLEGRTQARTAASPRSKRYLRKVWIPPCCAEFRLLAMLGSALGSPGPDRDVGCGVRPQRITCTTSGGTALQPYCTSAGVDRTAVRTALLAPR